MKKVKIIIASIILMFISIVVIRTVVDIVSKDIWEENADLFKEKVLNTELNNTEISFNELTPFEWDQVYFFRPYVLEETIYETIGYKWDSITFSVDGVLQIVFLKDDRVVCHIFGRPENLKYDILVEYESQKDFTLYHYEDNIKAKMDKIKIIDTDVIQIELLSL